MKALKKLPLLAWIIIAIASGVLIGMLTPGMISGINDATGTAIPTDLIVQLFVSFSTVFSAFLSFAIPLIIIGFIVPGIGSLAQGAGKMLGITVGLAYISSILAGFLDVYKRQVVVRTPLATRLQRLVSSRGMSEEDARARIAAQATDEQREAVATWIIDNGGSLEETAEQVRAVWAQMTAA